MAIITLQGKDEKKQGIYFEFDSNKEPLGVGGMGKVYKGQCINEHTGASRHVAIKFMFDDLPPSVIERARREASIRLHNDNLIEMIGFIETQERTMLGEIRRHYHVISELLEGVMLDDLLKGKLTDHDGYEIAFAQKLYKDYQNDPIHFAVYVTRNILSGIMALHDAGFIHRDIDPTNIMVTKDGYIKLIDFGIAKQMNTLCTHDKSLTTTGVFMGKPEYAAPELVVGDVKNQNKTTDIYAIGILLFQLIVGHPPFEGAQHEVLNAHLHKKIPLSLVRHSNIRKMIAKSTDKKQIQRYQSASEFRVDIERSHINSNTLIESIQNGIRNKWVVSASITLCVIIMAGLIIQFTPSAKKEISEPIAQNETSAEPVELQDHLIPDSVVVENEIKTADYETLVLYLESEQNRNEALKEVTQAARSGNSHAVYLLGRLHYKKIRESEFLDKEIIGLQQKYQITLDNYKAHLNNIEAVELDPTNYKALFELGLDYSAGDVRIKRVERDLQKARKYLNQALENARIKNDSFYENMIGKELKRIQ